jgi:hypothetical protein
MTKINKKRNNNHSLKKGMSKLTKIVITNLRSCIFKHFKVILQILYGKVLSFFNFHRERTRMGKVRMEKERTVKTKKDQTIPQTKTEREKMGKTRMGKTRMAKTRMGRKELTIQPVKARTRWPKARTTMAKRMERTRTAKEKMLAPTTLTMNQQAIIR